MVLLTNHISIYIENEKNIFFKEVQKLWDKRELPFQAFYILMKNIMAQEQ